MDTKEVASRIGTTARQLRQFLRSAHSTFVPVGSGSRYDFTERELSTIQKRFNDWVSAGKPKPDTASPTLSAPPASKAELDKQMLKDMQVWIEEQAERRHKNMPSVKEQMEGMRDLRVKRRALADARAAEDRLELRLMAVGLHLTQLGDVRDRKSK